MKSCHYLAVIILSFLLPTVSFGNSQNSMAGTLTITAEAMDGGLIDLNGQWLFAWEQWLEPGVNVEAQNLAPIQVPGTWPKAYRGDAPISKIGYGTYVLTVKLPASEKELALRVPELPSNYRLYIDGQLQLEKGRLGKNMQESRVGRGTELIRFSPNGGQFTLMIHTSSFHHREGGIWNPIQLARPALMQENVNRKFVLDAFLLGILAIMGSYHIGLFLLRSKDRSSLFFAIMCATVFLRISAISDYGFMARAFPDLDSEWHKRAEFLIIILGGPIFFSFLRNNYREQFSAGIERLFWSIGGLGVLFLVLTQQRLYGYLLVPFEIFIVIGFCLGIFNLWKAIRKQRIGSLLALSGIVLFFASAINDVLYTNHVIATGLTLHLGFCTYILIQALVIAKRFSAAFLRVELDEKVISELNKKLEMQVVELDALVEQKTAHMKSMFQTINQAIFTVDKDGFISEERSNHSDKILQGAVSIQDFLARTGATLEERSYLDSVLISTVGLESFAFDANEHLLLKTVQRGTETFEIDWSPIVSRDDAISGLLVCVRDITEVARLRAESQQKDHRIIILSELLGMPAAQQKKNLRSLGIIIEKLLLIQNDVSKVREVLIELHTFKGNSRFFGFKTLSNLTHELESRVIQDMKSQAEAIPTLKALYDDYNQIFESNIGVHLQDGQVHVDRAILENLYSYFRSRRDLSATEMMFLDRLERELHLRLDTLLEGQSEKLQEIARKLGKETPEIRVTGNSMILPDQYGDVMSKILNHLIRNSLDHGLETAEERQKTGKAPRGTISIHLKSTSQHMELDFSDDGRGYNLKAIVKKANEQGLQTDGLSPEELVALTTRPQFSTKSEVSEISGRGIGMDAVQEFVNSLAGELKFKVSSVQDGFAKVSLVIRLPLGFLQSELRRSA